MADDPSDLPPATFYEALIAPRWTASSCTIGGAKFGLVRVLHPREGWINWILPAADADNMAAVLSRIAEELTRPPDAAAPPT